MGAAIERPSSPFGKLRLHSGTMVQFGTSSDVAGRSQRRSR